MMKERIDETNRQISSLTLTIRDTEELMNADDVSFLQVSMNNDVYYDVLENKTNWRWLIRLCLYSSQSFNATLQRFVSFLYGTDLRPAASPSPEGFILSELCVTRRFQNPVQQRRSVSQSTWPTWSSPSYRRCRTMLNVSTTECTHTRGLWPLMRRVSCIKCV